LINASVASVSARSGLMEAAAMAALGCAGWTVGPGLPLVGPGLIKAAAACVVGGPGLVEAAVSAALG
jgi:hypothetical protein